MQASELEGLWTRLHATRDPALRERMIVQYAPLVKYVVGRMAVSMPGVLGSEDIISYGTVGSFHRLARLTPDVLDLWARVVAAVPHARMVLKSPGIDASGPRQQIVDAFGRHGW
jgi:hypothetical protein